MKDGQNELMSVTKICTALASKVGTKERKEWGEGKYRQGRAKACPKLSFATESHFREEKG